MLVQFFLFLAFTLALISTWQRYKERALTTLELGLWSLVWLAGLLVSLKPELASRAALVLGVGRGADVVVYFGMVVLFALVFRLFLKIALLERQITTIVRYEALDEFTNMSSRATPDSDPGESRDHV